MLPSNESARPAEETDHGGGGGGFDVTIVRCMRFTDDAESVCLKAPRGDVGVLRDFASSKVILIGPESSRNRTKRVELSSCAKISLVNMACFEPCTRRGNQLEVR